MKDSVQVTIPGGLARRLEALIAKYVSAYDSEELARANIVRAVFQLGLIGLEEADERTPARGELVQ